MHTPESHKRYINQGATIRSCAYCGRPLTQAKGRVVEILDKEKRDPKAAVVKRYKMNDQRVIFHGACRTEGRRLLHKAEKQQRKLKQYVS